jgi:predicted ATPase
MAKKIVNSAIKAALLKAIDIRLNQVEFDGDYYYLLFEKYTGLLYHDEL